jgi:SAM-dependent methyltransferase
VSTDADWEQWGRRDPYYGVLADPRFRATVLTPAAREEFFFLGQLHVDQLLANCRRLFGGDFAPQRVLDFGCGVGRLLLPFAAIASEVVGVDVAPSMLAEARRNCDQAGLNGVSLVLSDDRLSQVQGQFDLVHSSLVIQHIAIERGLVLFEELVRRVRPGGVGAIHVAIAWDWYAEQRGVPPPTPAPTTALAPRRWFGSKTEPRAQTLPPTRASADPDMQMHFHNLSQLMFILQRNGSTWVHSELADHDGVLCAFLLFQGPVTAAPAPR